MNSGLGAIQRAILERLQDRGGWVNLQALTVYVYHPERFMWEGKHYWSEDPGRPGWSYTRTEYTATRRAVKRLLKRNLVKTRKLTGCAENGRTNQITQVTLSTARPDE
jgi:hypothetical protein